MGFLLLILIQTGLAQSAIHPSQAKPKKSVPPAASKDKSESASSKNNVEVLRVRGFAERLLSLKDVKTKSITIARVADLLWGADEPYARNLFKIAIGLLSPRSDAAATEISSLLRIRAEILSMVEGRDVKLAKQLAESAEPADKSVGAAERSRVDFHDAFGLINSDTVKAVNVVERTASNGIPPFIHSFLIMLRLKDEAAADALFLRLLDQLVANPGDDADALLRLGAYVFTSAKINPNDPNVPADTVIIMGVGDVLVPDLMADRPNIRPLVVRAYLRAAADVLLRQASNASRSRSFYVAGRILLPKYERYAPDLAPLVYSLMEPLGTQVSPELRQDSAYEGLKADTQQSSDDILEAIEKVPDAQRRDEQYLALVSDLWHGSQFARARSVAVKISDKTTQTELLNVIAFKEAAGKLKRTDGVAEAEEIAVNLPDGIERAILWLGITRAYIKAGNPQRVSMAANTMLTSIRRVNDARRPYLLLCASGQLARFDQELAAVTLVEAVNEFNKQSAVSLGEVEWERRVESGLLSRYFPLGIGGVLFDFGQALPPLLKADKEGTIAAVENLKGERPLAEALLAVTAAVMKPATP
ncbi:MAG TPA: hypothetical protein VKC61_24395 [Pyrinomonadaceae bacterium]|nr:hypothetical protein [Pyrinomonadaceae bacterium]